MHEPTTSQLEGSSTLARLAAHTAGLAPAPDCRGARRQRRGREPVDETRPRRRSGSASPSAPRGAPSRLTDAQLARLPAPRQQSPEAYCCRGAIWTRRRIAAVIHLEFGVSYHPRHVGRWCQVIRWSPHKPARRARQRDEAAITHGRQETWPALNKGRTRCSRPASL
jgi:transposase